jgi:hypothetical protein
MARWVAIVALLLGLGLTAFESFSDEAVSATPTTGLTEGTGGFPTPPPY